MSCPEIEKETGIKASAINGYASRIKYKIKRHNKDKIKFTRDDVDLMVALRFQGLTHDEIGEKFDCSYQKVSILTGKKYKMVKLRLMGRSLDIISNWCGLEPAEVELTTSRILAKLEGCEWERKIKGVSTKIIITGYAAAGGIN